MFIFERCMCCEYVSMKAYIAVCDYESLESLELIRPHQTHINFNGILVSHSKFSISSGSSWSIYSINVINNEEKPYFRFNSFISFCSTCKYGFHSQSMRNSCWWFRLHRQHDPVWLSVYEWAQIASMVKRKIKTSQIRERSGRQRATENEKKITQKRETKRATRYYYYRMKLCTLGKRSKIDRQNEYVAHVWMYSTWILRLLRENIPNASYNNSSNNMSRSRNLTIKSNQNKRKKKKRLRKMQLITNSGRLFNLLKHQQNFRIVKKNSH